METPNNLRYSSDHEWVLIDQGRARVGITDYAQDALGDVVFVDLPEVGADVTAGQQVAEVESTKSVSEIYAPLSGRVVAVNDLLEDAPQTLNSAPYDDGWIFDLELSDAGQVESLLTAESYTELTGE